MLLETCMFTFEHIAMLLYMCVSLWVLGKTWIRYAEGCRGKKKATSTTVHVSIACMIMIDVADRQKTLPAPQRMRWRAATYTDIKCHGIIDGRIPQING